MKKVEFINLTPHDINMNDGKTFVKSGEIARVAESFEETKVKYIKKVSFGGVSGLPDPKEGVMYIVSSVIMDALPLRADLCSPITFGPDVVKNEKGHIVSVPALKVRKGLKNE